MNHIVDFRVYIIKYDSTILNLLHGFYQMLTVVIWLWHQAYIFIIDEVIVVLNYVSIDHVHVLVQIDSILSNLNYIITVLV